MFINKNRLLSLSVLFLLLFSRVAAAESVAGKEQIAYLRLTGDYWQVWITDAKGKSHRQITSDKVDKTRASWFSNRARLLVNSNDGALAIIDIDTLARKPVALDSLEVFDAQLSPDDKKIIYTSTTSLQADNAEVWMANIDGSEKEKLTNNTSVALTPTWNNKNKSILFSAGKPGSNQEIWEVYLASRNSEQKTIAKSTSIDPSANKDGDILYSSNRAGNYSIWLMDSQQKQRQITYARGFDAQPSWSPDGKSFAFFRIEGAKKQIWIYDLSSNTEYPITPDNALSRYPSWAE